MKFLNHDNVIKARQLKERSELLLVRQLNHLYAKSDLGKIAQKQIHILTGEMLRHLVDAAWADGENSRPADRKRKEDEAQKVLAALAAEKRLRLWRSVPHDLRLTDKDEPDWRHLLAVHKRLERNECDIHDCADILRLFGAYAEESTTHETYIKAKRAQKEPHEELYGAFHKLESTKGAGERESVFDPAREIGPKGKGPRYRVRGESGAVAPEAIRELSYIKPTGILPEHLKNSFRTGDSPTVDSGCNRWALRMRSRSCQIDKAFGLPFGGDISGTTADSMYGLEVASKHVKLNTQEAWALDYLRLLPLISLVGLYNHTVLECALALMYCGIIDDYKIGYYSTLKPKGLNTDKWVCVTNSLKEMENLAPKIIVYTRQDLLREGKTKVLRGFLMENQYEINKFRQVASTKDFYKKAVDYPMRSAEIVTKLLLDAGLADKMVGAVMDHDRTTGRAVSVEKFVNETQYLLKRGSRTPRALLTIAHKRIGRRLRDGETVVF